ncbi:type II toxin-antitoxin system tRNA(fMet)-specific endonuclease VapC [Deinococcus sp. SL84]|uniref:type II toxin-antitoxin system tRNA(fMet)-specific endonuclease VapC n=1 Tax=Deinococcus sp. SL84 TaxID=2994663 RepID=UPI00227262F0|nr:type II toxin-antitoxin system VapC family toxin [Deinococcus sp. SL84]MCY1703883.1 type II toxin-antitoxin system VapC family toxin [Deinococcus sp. SL84]
MIAQYLLDTNICIYVIKRRPLQVLDRFNAHAALLAVSAMTVAELYFGVENSQQQERNRREVEDFLSRLEILEYDVRAASHFGNIKAALRRQGMPIGEADIHIAAHARSQGMVLVTNNTREFERVEGLRVQDWVQD